MGELDALRRSGGPGGVDQRQDVFGLDRPPAGLEVETRGLPLLELGERDRSVVRGVDEHDPLDHDPAPSNRGLHLGQEGALGDGDAVAGVREEILDLLRRGRVVDRKRDRTEVERGGIDEIELGPIGQHECDRVAAPDAERGQAAGDPAHPPRVLPIGDRHPGTGRAKCNLVGALRSGDLKRLAERPRPQRRRRSSGGLRGGALHRVPPLPATPPLAAPGSSRQRSSQRQRSNASSPLRGRSRCNPASGGGLRADCATHGITVLREMRRCSTTLSTTGCFERPAEFAASSSSSPLARWHGCARSRPLLARMTQRAPALPHCLPSERTRSPARAFEMDETQVSANSESARSSLLLLWTSRR